MLPLEGITIVDFSNWFPGPYCARLLSDLGARVIKVERTISGDPERKSAGTFSVVNAGKEGIAIDLSTSQGQEIAHRLLSKADVLLESFRPGTTTRLGIDYATVSSLKEDIIYCSITGFGQTGPLARQPAHNINAMAEAGILSMGGQAGKPPADNSGVWVADLSASMFAAVSIIGAVLQKVKNGKGAFIDISMSDCCISWLSGAWGEYYNGSKTKEEILGYPAYGVFEAKGGEYLAIAALDDRHWLALCKALDFKDYINNPSFSNINSRKQMRDKINSRIAKKVNTREREYWLELLKGIGIAANPVNTLEELAEHNHFLQRGLFHTTNNASPATGVAFPALVNNERWGKDRSSVPCLGQDTQGILQALGYSDVEIDNLAAKEIISIVDAKE